MKKEFLTKLTLIVFGLLLSFILSELILRIYNPFPIRLKGEELILPANIQIRTKNKYHENLDSIIVHSKNELGFRGEQKPKNLDDFTSIITIGGSTTECTLLSDGDDWTAIVGKEIKKHHPNIWINNAGLNGHSTFGHQILLNDYVSKLSPDYVLYLIGCNELDRKDLSKFDKRNSQKHYHDWKNYILKKSELINLVYNYKLVYDAKRKELLPKVVDFNAPKYLDYDSIYHDKQLAEQKDLIDKFENRLNKLIEKTKHYEITPILISQPTILGLGVDGITGAELERIKFLRRNGKTYWAILELYNKVTKKVAKEHNIHCIDLANELPKSTEYFYDFIHFTPEGSKKVGEIISKYMDAILKEK